MRTAAEVCGAEGWYSLGASQVFGKTWLMADNLLSIGCQGAMEKTRWRLLVDRERRVHVSVEAGTAEPQEEVAGGEGRDKFTDGGRPERRRRL